MNRTRLLALLAITIAAGLLFTGCNSPIDSNRENSDMNMTWHWVIQPETFTLWAGQNTNAGAVTVWNTTESLYVKYEMAADWWLEETHVHVATSLAGIPQKNGNPPPGRFEFSATHNPRVQTYTYAILLKPDWTVGTELYIATHAAAVKLDGNGIVIRRETGWAGDYNFPGRNWAKYLKFTVKRVYKDVTLPTEQVQMRGWHPNGDISYWLVELAGVPGGYDVWNGYWNGWCAEQFVYMYPNTWYNVTLWSTANPDLPERCRNAGWDNVNYVLNHKHPDATPLDIESAIWHLLGCGVYPSDPEAMWMVDQAVFHGDGWYPTAGDWIAVILESDANVQLCFLEVDP